MSEGSLTGLKISAGGFLVLKPDLDARIAETSGRGESALWSSQTLHRHLELLEGLVPRTVWYLSTNCCVALILLQNEASARAWVDAFMFRTSAMLPTSMRMVLNMEHVVPATAINSTSPSTLSGTVDYTAAVASPHSAGKSALTYLNRPAHSFF